jgi:hypothetical protein
VTWSWLWDGTPAPASVPDVPEWYVALVERKFKSCPPSLPANARHAALRIAGDRSTKAPRLSATLSDVTRRALAVLEPDLLYELLAVDDVEHSASRPSSVHGKTPRTGESPRVKWRRIAETMRGLAADLHVDGTRCNSTHVPAAFSVTADREGHVLHACFLLEQWANQAEARAASAATESSHAVSAKDSAPVHRARLCILASVLRASGQTWTDGDLADLIVASQRDWRQPPSPLAELYAYDWISEARRTDANRIALASWIGEQLPAPRTAPGRQLKSRRPPTSGAK